MLLTEKENATEQINHSIGYDRVHKEILDKIENQGILQGVRHYRKKRNRWFYDNDLNDERRKGRKDEILET